MPPSALPSSCCGTQSSPERPYRLPPMKAVSPPAEIATPDPRLSTRFVEQLPLEVRVDAHGEPCSLHVHTDEEIAVLQAEPGGQVPARGVDRAEPAVAEDGAPTATEADGVTGGHARAERALQPQSDRQRTGRRPRGSARNGEPLLDAGGPARVPLAERPARIGDAVPVLPGGNRSKRGEVLSVAEAEGSNTEARAAGFDLDPRRAEVPLQPGAFVRGCHVGAGHARRSTAVAGGAERGADGQPYGHRQQRRQDDGHRPLQQRLHGPPDYG